MRFADIPQTANIKHDIDDTIRRLAPMYVEQLVQYYSQRFTPKQIRKYIAHLLQEEMISADEAGFIYPTKNYWPMLRKYNDAILKANWVLASMGCYNVRDAFLTGYPRTMTIIAEDNRVYDIVVAEEEKDILAGIQLISVENELRKESITAFNESCEKDEDKIDADNPALYTRHILLAPNIKMAMPFRGQGYKLLCVLDADNMPHYYNIEKVKK